MKEGEVRRRERQDSVEVLKCLEAMRPCAQSQM